LSAFFVTTGLGRFALSGKALCRAAAGEWVRLALDGEVLNHFGLEECFIER
jgi:hypothetical protein